MGRVRFIAVIGVLLSPAMPGARSGLQAQHKSRNVAEQFLFAAANQDRVSHGLPALVTDEHLTLAAERHAREMAKHGTLSHQFAGEADLAVRGEASGARFSLITENVAEASDAAGIHDLWMQSAGHRANLLDRAVDAVGIAVIEDQGMFYAVEDFARRSTVISLAEQEATVAGLLKSRGLIQAGHSDDARRTCEMNAGHAGQRLPWFIMRYTSADIQRLPQQLLTRLATGKYREAAVGACPSDPPTPFTSYHLAVLLYP